jgi:asparagine synthase (glutamine-hydrolysing)
MCGILGFNWRDEHLVLKLNKLLNHRGPEDSGEYSDEYVTLGHTRLSILDLTENGKQPMMNEKETIILTFNGEIFNYQEIKKELEKKGYKFKSKTDTEVLLLGYEEYGIKILDKLNGQFAFCIYDTIKKKLILARDRIGINPLYYYWDEKKFIFGSELKVILKSGVPLKINDFARSYYLVYGHCPRKQSIIENAYKLEPGHYLIFNVEKNKIETIKKYWQIEFTDKITNEKEAITKIREIIDESVKKRLIADVPVGAFLSGGLDSSTIVAYASKYKKNINTFSVKFDYEEFDESEHAKKIAKLFKTRHHVIKFKSKDVKEILPKLIHYYSEPFADPSMIPTFLVSQKAKEKVTVCLSGDGGDELFGGYDSHKHHRILRLTDYYPSFINKIINKINQKIPLHRYIKSYFSISTHKKEEQYGGIMTFLLQQDIMKITKMDSSKFYGEYQNRIMLTNWLNTSLYVDLHNYLPEDILTKVDRASMANSLETRPPLLDHKLIELACRIHPKLKLRGQEGKYILKKAMEGILPKEIIYRKKKGFAVPLKHYLNHELKEYVDELKNTDMTKYGLENINFDEYDNKHLLIWRYLMYKKWMDTWMIPTSKQAKFLSKT